MPRLSTRALASTAPESPAPASTAPASTAPTSTASASTAPASSRATVRIDEAARANSRSVSDSIPRRPAAPAAPPSAHKACTSAGGAHRWSSAANAFREGRELASGVRDAGDRVRDARDAPLNSTSSRWSSTSQSVRWARNGDACASLRSSRADGSAERRASASVDGKPSAPARKARAPMPPMAPMAPTEGALWAAAPSRPSRTCPRCEIIPVSCAAWRRSSDLIAGSARKRPSAAARACDPRHSTAPSPKSISLGSDSGALVQQSSGVPVVAPLGVALVAAAPLSSIWSERSASCACWKARRARCISRCRRLAQARAAAARRAVTLRSARS